MLVECSDLMESLMPGNNNYLFVEDFQKFHFFDQQMMFYPSSPGQIQVAVDSDRYSVKFEEVASTLKARDDRGIDVFDQRVALGCDIYAQSRNDHTELWLDGEEGTQVFEKEGISSSARYTDCPSRVPILPSSSSSSMESPAVTHSPDIKRVTPEPRSVLDLAISPRIVSRSPVSSSYEFAHSSLVCNSVLTSQGEFISDFERHDVPAHLNSIMEDSSEWAAATNTREAAQTSQLWMDSVIQDLGFNNVQQTSSMRMHATEYEKEVHNSSMESPSQSHGPRGESSDHELSEDETNGDQRQDDVQNPQPQTAQSSGKREEVPHREVGVELVNLLLACAEAVTSKSLSLVNPLFAQLGELASPEGSSMQRVAAYFTEGLAIRCSILWPNIYQSLPYNLDLSEEDSLSAFHILNHVCPYTKFAHFTSNEVIVQAFEGSTHVHVIDFDIKQGLQWPGLFQSLATRPGGPPTHVRITGVGECKEEVQDTGDRLAEFADALNIPFEFHAVIDKLEDVRLWMLHVKEKETVAVNCQFLLHRTLNDDSDTEIKDFLGLLKSTKPKVLAIVEQEASHNGPFFEGRHPRFLESLQYYAAIFDSLDMNMPNDSVARMKAEQFFAREIRNIISREGSERTERHENLAMWQRHLIQAGYESVPVGKRSRTQSRLLLEMFSCKNYTLTEKDGTLTLGWAGRPLFTASAWTPKLLHK